MAFSPKGNNMKKTFQKIASILILAVVVTVFSVAFVGCNTGLSVDGSAKNVILLIGDGMGLEHLEAVKAYYGLDSLYMESMTDRYFEVTTASRDSEVTDSSASSTALSCGLKADNKTVAFIDGQDVENMSEFIDKNNMNMGIVVTEKVTGGTPSSFASHSSSRSNAVNVFDGYMSSGVDLFISQYNKDTLSSARENTIIEKGFTRINSVADLTTNCYSADKIFATDTEFAGYGEEGASLKDASIFALNYLKQKNDNGFFAMIESSHIDKYSHSGDFEEMAEEVRAFDETIKAVIEWAKQDGNTMVIITADHETGGLVYNPGDNFDNNLFKTKEHSGVNVGLFIYGLDENDFKDRTIVDNVEIGQLIRAYITNYKR